MKKLILFGSGAFGLKALEYFGNEKVYAFCDNNCQKISTKYSVLYIPFRKLLDIYGEYIIVISTNTNNSYEVADQLLDNGISDFIVLDEVIWNEMNLYSAEDYMSILNTEGERYKRERNQFILFQRNMREQLEFLKKLTPIKSLRPAYGYLSYVQDRITKFTKEVFEELKGLNIKPFVVGGTALGFYRCGGFIPWDDDVDFGLIRGEYMQLLQYGKDKFIFLEEKASFDNEDNKRMVNTLKTHPNEFIMVASPNCIQIKRGTSEIDVCTVDFFSYDFYDDDYAFSEHEKIIEECSGLRYTERGNEKVLQIIKNNKYIRNNSTKLYFGLDNMDSFVCSNNVWIEKEYLFPLQVIEFNGISCYAPNQLESMLSFYYKDYNEFPKNITCHHLMEAATFKLERGYIYCGILAEDVETVEKGMALYEKFRSQGIYCVWILKEMYCKDIKGYQEVEKLLLALRVEFKKHFDNMQDFVILKDRGSNIKKLKKPYFFIDEIAHWGKSEIKYFLQHEV